MTEYICIFAWSLGDELVPFRFIPENGQDPEARALELVNAWAENEFDGEPKEECDLGAFEVRQFANILSEGELTA